ncbi:hypothetical protein EOL96_05875 [Candidatus Saccharibacteria bacterium]|nr:hypothetical protein [Candidatus Saccharibacteria bacterium]
MLAPVCDSASSSSASKPGKPWQNGFMERTVKSVKEEIGSLTAYGDVDELYVGITNAIY